MLVDFIRIQLIRLFKSRQTYVFMAVSAIFFAWAYDVFAVISVEYDVKCATAIHFVFKEFLIFVAIIGTVLELPFHKERFAVNLGKNIVTSPLYILSEILSLGIVAFVFSALNTAFELVMINIVSDITPDYFSVFINSAGQMWIAILTGYLTGKFFKRLRLSVFVYIVFILASNFIYRFIEKSSVAPFLVLLNSSYIENSITGKLCWLYVMEFVVIITAIFYPLAILISHKKIREDRK